MIRASVRIDDVRDDRFQLIRLHWEGRITGRLGGTAEMIVTEHTSVDPDGLVGRRLTLDFVDDESHREGATPTSVIRSIDQDFDLSNGMQILRIALEPVFINLSVEEHCCTYGDKTVQEIITEVLERNDLVDGRDFEFRLGDDGYQPIPFVAQFDESDLAFIQRLAEHWGLSTGLEARPGVPDLMVFADDPRAFSAIPLASVPYVETGRRVGVTRLSRAVNALPAEVVLQNYVHDRPEQALRVVQKVAFGGAGRQVEHDQNFRTTDRDGRLLAKLRAEALSCRRVVYTGEAASMALRAGQLCTITGHPVWGDVKLLVTSVVLDFENTPLMQGRGEVPVLTERFTAMPLDLDGVPLRYRPERTTAKPRIYGVLHGLIEAEEDRLNRKIDAQGSYRVQLLAHGSDRGPVKALYPGVRMAQPTGGAGAGMHFPLHPGTEVLLAFVDGDPDRPFICGTVPNPRDRSVVDERSATKNVLQTAAGSRLEFDDGLLTAASGGGVGGDGITGKLHVPYEASRTGSYLRLGRADDREAPESRAPASDQAGDGWYDFTNGRRTSITMGESVVVRGGQSTDHQHGDYFRLDYPAALSPLAPPDGASRQAGAGSAETGGGQATQAVSTSSADIGSPTTVYGSYDGVFGKHYMTVTESHTSSYARGTLYGYSGGSKIYSTAGASVSHTAGLSYSTMVGLKVSYELSASISYTGSLKFNVADGSSYGLTKAKTETASEKLEYSVRAPTNAKAQLRSQKALRLAALGLLATEVAKEEVVSTTLAFIGKQPKDVITDMDRYLSYTRTAVGGASILAAIAAAVAILGLAKTKAANIFGTGSRLTLEPTRGSLMAGWETVPAEVAVTEAGAKMSHRTLATAGSLVRTAGGEVLLQAGPATFIRMTQNSILMSAGGASLAISGGTIRASAAFQGSVPMNLLPPGPVAGL